MIYKPNPHTIKYFWYYHPCVDILSTQSRFYQDHTNTHTHTHLTCWTPRYTEAFSSVSLSTALWWI